MTRECGYYRELFGQYIDGELCPEARQDLAGHLSGCPECASAFGEEWRRRLGEGPVQRWAGEKLIRRVGFPRGRSMTWVILLGVVIAVLFFQPFGRRTGGRPAGEVGDLLGAQQRLLEALVAVALERQKPVARQDKLVAFQVLERAGKALLAPAGETALAGLFHPRFQLVRLGVGGAPAGPPLDREDLANQGPMVAELLEVEQVRFWSSEEDTITLYGYRTGSAARLLAVLLRTEEGLLLYRVYMAATPGRSARPAAPGR